MTGHYPRIDADRLWADLTDLGRIGATADGGVSRPALSSADRQARTWLADRMQAAGMVVSQDAAANQIGRLTGQNAHRVLAMGSHLDTVPNGGRFDGALGVLASLECARTLAGNGIRLPFDLEVINCCDEEGTHIAGTVGSRAMTGLLTIDELRQLRQTAPTALAQALAGLGLDPVRIGEARRKTDRFVAFLELHIEQGSRLADEGMDIGAVTGIVGIRRLQVTVTGCAGHAGTTPMHRRRDALVMAAPFFTRLPDWVAARNPEMVGTVGRLAVEPGAANVIPGRCRFVVEIRGLAAADLDAVAESITAYAAERHGWQVQPVYAKPPVLLADAMVDRVMAAAAAEELASLRMPSGAGHDAQSFALAGVPTAMVFVPCRDGLSHCPAESITPAQAARGCQVLLDTLLDLAREAPAARD